MFWKPRFKVTKAPPKEVAFYYAQYMEVMKHGHDDIDDKMKRHLYDIVMELGVPEAGMFLEQELEEIIEPQEPEERTLLVHATDEIRELKYGDSK